MKILVIDDEPSVRTLIADALADEGHEVILAGSGDQGLAAIQRDPPDAVFLDVVMPGTDGIEVLRQIRERDPDLPVIILTGWANEQEIEDLRRLGVADVVQKPVPLRNLTRALARGWRNSRSVRPLE